MNSRAMSQPTGPVTVLIPTYNEAANLPELARRLFDLSVDGLRLVIIDDNSPDGSGQVAEGLASQYNGRISVVHRQGKLGLGSAYREGFRVALQDGSSRIVQMDADLSHDPKYIPRLLEHLDTCDVVVGSRYTKGGGLDPSWKWYRRLLSYMGNLYIRLIAGVRVRDATSGFKAFRRDALLQMDLNSLRCRGYAFQAEMAYACQQAGHRVVEHPITFFERSAGESKMSLAIVAEALLRLLALRFKL